MLTPSEFDQLLKASCLDLPDHEKETFLSKLQNIIQFLDRIQNTSLDEQTQPLITPLEDQKSIPQTNGTCESFDFFHNIKHQISQDHIVIKSPVTSKE